jgi:hypothetical protein
VLEDISVLHKGPVTSLRAPWPTSSRCPPLSLLLWSRPKGCWSGLQGSPVQTIFPTSLLMDTVFGRTLLVNELSLVLCSHLEFFSLFLCAINFFFCETVSCYVAQAELEL